MIFQVISIRAQMNQLKFDLFRREYRQVLQRLGVSEPNQSSAGLKKAVEQARHELGELMKEQVICKKREFDRRNSEKQRQVQELRRERDKVQEQLIELQRADLLQKREWHLLDRRAALQQQLRLQSKHQLQHITLALKKGILQKLAKVEQLRSLHKKLGAKSEQSLRRRLLQSKAEWSMQEFEQLQRQVNGG